ncbi:MAG: response regulator [Lachnospiraceae bacterium]
MIAITVDDERPMLKTLTTAVSASPDIASVEEFSTCSAALAWVNDNPVDIAFLDISMRGMGGLALAEKILEVRPECKIIFCTGFTEYALDAIKLHCTGYLVKPITAEAVQKEINYIIGEKTRKKLLRVNCFGNFEVYNGDKILNFKRIKSKELLAVLVDRNGAGMTSKQICALMWPESTNDNKNMNYLRQLFCDLRNALDEVGAAELLRQNGHVHSLDTVRIDCDYFNYLKTGKPEFHGEYMTQYSWAEETCAMLWGKTK